MIKRGFLLFLVINFTTRSISQVQNRFAAWVGSTNSLLLNKKWGLQLDLSFRSNDQVKNFQTIIIRPGISYRFNKTLTGLIGYSNNINRTIIGEVSGYPTEHQVWEQLFIRHRSFKRLHTLHRPLLEERFISNPVLENNEIKTAGRSFAVRFRYLFRNMLPFSNKEVFTKGVYMFASQELFLIVVNKENLNGKTFDQFRSVTGFGYRFSPKWDIEAGYLYRDLATRSSVHFHDHIIQMSSFIRL